MVSSGAGSIDVRTESGSSKYEELSTLLYDIKPHSRVAVELHQVPDPDTVGCGLFMYEILKKHGHHPTITHAGFISHPENRQMVKKLHVPLINYTMNGHKSHHPEKYPNHYDYFFFVDHAGPNSLWYEEGKLAGKTILGIMDHHENSELKVSSLFSDRRPVGSVCSIGAEYLVDGAAELFTTSELERIATGLFFGLIKDTQSLRKGVDVLDRRMHEYLYPLANQSVIDSIERIEWEPKWMDYFGMAISSRETKHHVTVASVGCIDPHDRDVIAVTADQLLKEHGTQTVYVVGIRPDYIDVSIRTKDPDYDFRTARRQYFPEGKGGGRKGMGSFRLPRQGEADTKEYEQNVLTEFKKKVF
jgi:nanoRNase/pAp phosphatase (c-di-AMP/oligoRNAs hydrolase)